MESVFTNSTYKDYYRKKCENFEIYKYCKNYKNCPFYHPPLCKFKQNCRFKNTTCKFFHKREKVNMVEDKITNPVKILYKDVCIHSKDGKMYFTINEKTNFDEIVGKIKSSLENEITNEFVLKKE